MDRFRRKAQEAFGTLRRAALGAAVLGGAAIAGFAVGGCQELHRSWR